MRLISYIKIVLLGTNLEFLSQENVGGTTYYYTPDENVKPTIEEQNLKHSSQTSEKMKHSMVNRRTHSPSQPSPLTQNQLYSVYSGPSSFLQNHCGQQRSSFFINEDLRADLIQRNSIALTTSDPDVYPG